MVNWMTPAGIQEHSKPNQKLKAGLEKLGVHCGEIPRNCSTAHTCGHCCFGCPSGDKQDGTGTYLSDAAGHGACIFTGGLQISDNQDAQDLPWRQCQHWLCRL